MKTGIDSLDNQLTNCLLKRIEKKSIYESISKLMLKKQKKEIFTILISGVCGGINKKNIYFNVIKFNFISF